MVHFDCDSACIKYAWFPLWIIPASAGWFIENEGYICNKAEEIIALC